MVGIVGLEPTRITPSDFESDTSTSSAISPCTTTIPLYKIWETFTRISIKSFYEWILLYVVWKKRITLNQKRMIVSYIIDNVLLMFTIHETNSDAVYTRSFTVLLFVVIIEKSDRDEWLNVHVQNVIFDLLFSYVMMDPINRGKDDARGGHMLLLRESTYSER